MATTQGNRHQIYLLRKQCERQLHQSMSKDQFATIIFDISRFFDKQINRKIRVLTVSKNIHINRSKRIQIRNQYLGYPTNISSIYPLPYTQKDLYKAFQMLSNGLTRDRQKLVNNIISRYKLYDLHQSKDRVSKYVQYIHKLQVGKNQLIYFQVSPYLAINDIARAVKDNYDRLSNYHMMVFNFHGLKGKLNWSLIFQTIIFMENFLLEKHFHVFNKFNKKKDIEILKQFLKTNKYIKNSEDLDQDIKKFYSAVSYGFQFKDLFIDKECHNAMLVMQKVQLDDSPKRCPICLAMTHKSNSYPQMLFKSFECQNPKCPAMSKSNRGKRFDMLSAKRQIMVQRNDVNDHIDQTLIKALHSDIANDHYLTWRSAISLYTWSEDKALLINIDTKCHTYKNRSICLQKISHKHTTTNLYNHLPIVQLLRRILKHIVFHRESKGTNVNIQGCYVINDNSANIQAYITNDNRPTSAITSPPYYNARKYSQWSNFLCYIIDMMIDAKAVYNILSPQSAYIYNVGDIVDQDNMYVRSRMSINRIALGAYSSLILQLAGFRITNDIIWNKGEVQSKRNASPNHFPGYIKPINSYEHDLVAIKGSLKRNVREPSMVNIAPVKKINSKGKNTYGHSAPYPKQLAELILPFTQITQKGGIILDPFLGSGTTCIMARDHNIKSIGFELNDKYYILAVKKIKQSRQTTLF